MKGEEHGGGRVALLTTTGQHSRWREGREKEAGGDRGWSLMALRHVQQPSGLPLAPFRSLGAALRMLLAAAKAARAALEHPRAVRAALRATTGRSWSG